MIVRRLTSFSLPAMITTTARCCLQIRSIWQFFWWGRAGGIQTHGKQFIWKKLWWTETKALHKSCCTLEHVLLKQRLKKPEAEVNIFLLPCHVKTWKIHFFFRRLKKCLTEYTHTGAQATIFITGGAWHMCLYWHLRRVRPAKQLLASDIIPPITPSGFWMAFFFPPVNPTMCVNALEIHFEWMGSRQQSTDENAHLCPFL